MIDGIIFETAEGGVRLRMTLRSDLAADRLLAHVHARDAREVAVIQTPTRLKALKLRRVIERAFCKPGSGGIMSLADVPDALNRCRQHGAMRDQIAIFTADDPPVAKSRRATRIVPASITVEDPHSTRDQLQHEIEQDVEQPRDVTPGFIRVPANLAGLIGGLSRLNEITQAQAEGAKDFRSDAERAQIGGGRAIDYSATRVDTSGTTADMVELNGLAAREAYGQARKSLRQGGTTQLLVAERIIVEGMSVAECAQSLGMGSGGSARRRIRKAALDAATALARHYGHDRTNRRSRTKFDGEQPREFTLVEDRALISTRRR